MSNIFGEVNSVQRIAMSVFLAEGLHSNLLQKLSMHNCAHAKHETLVNVAYKGFYKTSRVENKCI